MMTVNVVFAPQYTDHIRKGKSEIWCTINYKMFMELEGEFSKADYPATKTVKLEGEEKNEGIWEFDQEFEYPYGEFNIDLKFDGKGKTQDELDPKEIPD